MVFTSSLVLIHILWSCVLVSKINIITYYLMVILEEWLSDLLVDDGDVWFYRLSVTKTCFFFWNFIILVIFIYHILGLKLEKCWISSLSIPLHGSVMLLMKDLCDRDLSLDICRIVPLFLCKWLKFSLEEWSDRKFLSTWEW